MNDSWFEQIESAASFLNIDLSAQEMANLCIELELNDSDVKAVSQTFDYLKQIIKTASMKELMLLRLLQMTLILI